MTVKLRYNSKIALCFFNQSEAQTTYHCENIALWLDKPEPHATLHIFIFKTLRCCLSSSFKPLPITDDGLQLPGRNESQWMQGCLFGLSEQGPPIFQVFRFAAQLAEGLVTVWEFSILLLLRYNSLVINTKYFFQYLTLWKMHCTTDKNIWCQQFWRKWLRGGCRAPKLNIIHGPKKAKSGPGWMFSWQKSVLFFKSDANQSSQYVAYSMLVSARICLQAPLHQYSVTLFLLGSLEISIYSLECE